MTEEIQYHGYAHKSMNYFDDMPNIVNCWALSYTGVKTSFAGYKLFALDLNDNRWEYHSFMDEPIEKAIQKLKDVIKKTA